MYNTHVPPSSLSTPLPGFATRIIQGIILYQMCIIDTTAYNNEIPPTYGHISFTSLEESPEFQMAAAADPLLFQAPFHVRNFILCP